MEKVSKTLSAHLSKVTDCIARLDNYGDRIPQIEIDILLSGLRDMYTEAYRLSRYNGISPEVDTETSHNPSAAAPEATNVLETAAVIAPMETTPEEETLTEEKTTEAVAPESLPAQDESTDEVPTELPNLEMEKAPEISPLMVDTEATPTYAEEEPSQESVIPSQEQPSMEEIEGKQNDDLFTETTEDNTPIETSPKQNEQPQTLWDKLQETKQAPTLGETVVTGRTISDLFKEKQEVSDAATSIVQTPTTPTETQQTVLVEEPVITQQNEPTSSHTQAEKISQPTKKTEEPIHQSSLFDYLKKGDAPQPTTATLADSLKSNKEESFEQKINTARVSDLRTIININDKFSFMNELFHNNMKGYNDFILRLNAIADREEALAYVNSVAGQYEWDDKSPAVQTFFKVFDRKF